MIHQPFILNSVLRTYVAVLSIFVVHVESAWAEPAPTISNRSYGGHDRNQLDLWKAPGSKPAPLIVFLHGGGYRAGDKSAVQQIGILKTALKAGVSVASVNYRFRPTPIQDILRDCGRAVQHVRAHADELGVDPNRIALYGGSAGATASLWLAFHDDLRDPQSADPVLRQSSKPTCVVAFDCQFSLDVPAWKDVFGESVQWLEREQGGGGDFYGMPMETVVSTERGRAILMDCHLPHWIDAKDPPVFLVSRTRGGPVQDYNQLVHHPLHARVLAEACGKAGVSVVTDAPGEGLRPAAGEPPTPQVFLQRHLLRP